MLFAEEEGDAEAVSDLDRFDESGTKTEEYLKFQASKQQAIYFTFYIALFRCFYRILSIH